MLEAQPHATQTDAGQAAISEIRPQSSRRDFSQDQALLSCNSLLVLGADAIRRLAAAQKARTLSYRCSQWRCFFNL